MDNGIGAPVPRTEDARLLTGHGRYSDDASAPGQAYAYVVRSPYAHAAIGGIDTDAATAAPGVLAVLTAADAKADSVGDIPHFPNPADAIDVTKRGIANRDGRPVVDFGQPALAGDKVRFVGEGVALVVAETLDQARDAAELVDIDWRPLPALNLPSDATADGAPLIWDGAPGNLCADPVFGDRQATDAAFAAAHAVVRLDNRINRIVVSPMETRAALAEFDPATGKTTLHTGSQGAARYKMVLARVLGVAEETIRVVTEDVGGGFGIKSHLYPEHVLTAWAARRLGRPVKYVSDRSEAFLTDAQGRDLEASLALALDADGRFLAVRGHLVQNNGGHTCSYVPVNNGARIYTSLYDIPAGFIAAEIVLTNRAPISPYRGAGRPEALHNLERLIDVAARQLGFDRVELRRRNLIPPDKLPYTSAFGITYENGAFEANMDAALRRADWDGFPARRAEARRTGMLRGVGLANSIEIPVGWVGERTEVTVRPDDTLDVVIGTQSSGQGHETSFAQMMVDLLGVPFDSIRIRTGDTDFVKSGGGSHSVRTMRLGGVILCEASDRIIERGKQIAAHVLEASAADIAFANGRFAVVGTDRSLGLFDVARLAAGSDLPEALSGPLAADAEIDRRVPAHPTGCAVSEVEIDLDTGVVRLVRHTAEDDVGRVINPLLLAGQTHGGIAQAAGQALLEDCVYDSDGQLVTGSFMDYGLPRADDLPMFDVATAEDQPSAGNRLGIKGGGESGLTPATASIVNAIVDALADFGVTNIEMPATPEKIWRAINGL